MKFSVIVPVYGVEAYLRQCLDSLVVQSYKDFEVILVDDGSRDDCPSICDAYVATDARFKVVHKENEGRARARQVGVEASVGDYVVCVDGDDWVSPDCLLNLYTIIDRYNPDVVLCDNVNSFPDKNVFCHNSLRKGYYSKEDLERYIYPILIYSNKNLFPAQLWAKAFRRSIYMRHQLRDFAVEMGEDRACVIASLYNSDSMYVADYCDYYYRQSITSITKAKKPLRTDGPKLIYLHLCNHIDLRKCNLENQLYQGTCHSLFNVCKSQFYSANSYLITKKQIEEILNDSIYDKCIKNAKFNGSVSRKLMHLALKYRMYFLIFMYSKL